MFIIPVKKEGAIGKWPYSFLDLSNSGCFAWYSILLLVNILVYMLWYLIAAAVDRYVHPKDAFQRHESMTVFIGGVEVNSKHAGVAGASDYNNAYNEHTLEDHLMGVMDINDFETVSPQHTSPVHPQRAF